MKFFSIAVACVALAAGVPAYAATTINFDTLPNGSAVADMTLITNQYASVGVTFSATAANGSTVAPVATSYAAGQANANYSGNFLGNAGNPAPGNARYDTISLLFSNVVSGFSTSLNNFSNVSMTTFNAYGINGNLLETLTYKANTGWAVVSLTSANIARIDLVGSKFQGNTLFFGIDQVTFTPAAVNAAVPEPTTWAMMIAGFGLVGGAMRRRKTSVAFA